MPASQPRKVADLEQEIEILENEIQVLEERVIHLEGRIDEAKEIVRMLNDSETA